MLKGGKKEGKMRAGRSKVIVSMLVVQIIATGLQLLSRIVLVHGTFVYALTAYRNLVAALAVAPLVYFLERDSLRKLRWSVFFWLFMAALSGTTVGMGLFYYGLRDTSATYGTNFLNVVPIFTFVFSILLGVEKLGLGSRAGKVKVVGMMVCVAGALTSSLYQGKPFYINLAHLRSSHSNQTAPPSNSNLPHQARGTLLLLGSCLGYAAWYILQVKLLKVFPYRYCTSMLTSAIATMQSLLIGLCLDSRKAVWTLSLNLQLLTILYSGVVATAATFCIVQWAISKKGPTYPAMFNPLSLIFVAMLEALLLGQELRLGMIIGMTLVIIGLYLFLWGKRTVAPPNVRASEEMQIAHVDVTVTPWPPSAAVTPLRGVTDDDGLDIEVAVNRTCNHS